MKAFVTGATGFIGSNLVDYLVKKGDSVVALVRNPKKASVLPEGVRVVEGDLFDEFALREGVKGVDVVYHLGGIVRARTKEEYFRVNVDGTKNVVRAIEQEDVPIKRFVYFSSLSASGPALMGGPKTEDSPCIPVNLYGESKLSAERFLLGECSLPVSILRPPVVYGPRDRDVFNFFLMIRRGIMPLWAWEQWVSIIYVEDLVRAAVELPQHTITKGKVYFVSDGKGHKMEEVGDIASAVLRVAPIKIRIPKWILEVASLGASFLAFFQQKPPVLCRDKLNDLYAESWVVDDTKARKEWGFKHEYDLREGVRKTLEWYIKEGWL